jgi:hypothetical protein
MRFSAPTGLAAIECIGARACDAVGQQSTPVDVGVLLGISLGRAGTAHSLSGTTSTDGIACIGETLCYGLGTDASATGAFEQLSATITTNAALRATPNPVRAHHSITFTAIVSPSPSAGSISFTSNGNTIAGCAALAVRAGFARCRTSFAKSESVVIRTTYSGDSDELGSTSKPVIVKVLAE